MELGPPYGPKDRGPLVLRAGGPAGGTPTVPLGPRTGPEDQGPPVLGPVGGPRAGCGIVCSRRGWDLRWAALGRAQKRREGQLELYSLRPSPPVSTSTSYNSGFWALFGTF